MTRLEKQGPGLEFRELFWNKDQGWNKDLGWNRD
jgi:hypothetical protein